MPKFTVVVRMTGDYELTVDAKDRKEAEDVVLEMAGFQLMATGTWIDGGRRILESVPFESDPS
jgi:hypothetical protein